MIDNKIKKTIHETIVKHEFIAQGDHIIIGVSGGPDSICLFNVLTELATELSLTLHPVHINHGFRPGAAEEDQSYVEEFCAAKGYPCKSFRIDCAAMAKELGMTSEEAGRKARYDAFRKVCYDVVKSSGDLTTDKIKIAVAHNANDQAETILFRILRGTGIDGLAGIEYSRREGEFLVIRPLLDVWRTDIEQYCQENKLNPARDHTNEEAIYARNKIRLELIPYIEKEYNENIKEGLVRLGKIAAADKEYLWSCAEKEMNRLQVTSELTRPTETVLDRKGLSQLHEALRHRIIMKAFAQQGLTSDITAERLAAADKIIMKKQGPKTVEFPRGYRLTVAAGKVRVGRK